MSPPPLCPYCHHTMQLLTAVVEDERKVSESYVCACRGKLYYLNIHSGDATKKENQ